MDVSGGVVEHVREFDEEPVIAQVEPLSMPKYSAMVGESPAARSSMNQSANEGWENLEACLFVTEYPALTNVGRVEVSIVMLVPPARDPELGVMLRRKGSYMEGQHIRHVR